MGGSVKGLGRKVGGTIVGGGVEVGDVGDDEFMGTLGLALQIDFDAWGGYLEVVCYLDCLHLEWSKFV